MRPAPALAFALFLFVAAAPAGANTAHLNWDECSVSGAKVRTFACNTNAGSNTLVGTVAFDTPLGGMHGFSAELVAWSDAATVPPWWQLYNAGSCRGLNLESDLNPPASIHCNEYWYGYAAGGITTYQVGGGGPNRVRIRVEVAMDPMWEVPIAAGEELYLFQLLIRNAGTVGGCAGCETPTAIGFADLRLLSTGVVGGVTVHPQFPESFASWQCPLTGGAPAVEISCPTSAARPTWGAVKSLYR